MLPERYHARFWAKVLPPDPDTGCWNWAGATVRGGYGHYSYWTNGKQEGSKCVTLRSARVAYALLVGALPETCTVDHLCENKLCVNPAHLELVTHSENLRRRHARTRARKIAHGLTVQ